MLSSALPEKKIRGTFCDIMDGIEKAINNFFNSGSLKAAVYRANAIFSFACKVLASLAGICWLSTAFLEPRTIPSIEATKVYVVRGEGSCLTGARDYYDNTACDQGFINFDMKVDINPLFNWNVKVIFLYLTADYATEEASSNTAVLWDKIVMAGEKMNLDLKNIKTKYYFRDSIAKGGLLSNENVTLPLHWNVMPHMGHLSWVQGEGQTSRSFPAEYYSVRKGSRQ